VKPIISPNCRIRYPELFAVGDDSIVDDFCYFSTRVEIGRSVHVAAGCVVAGGRERTFRMADFAALAHGAKVYCTSDDFVHDLAGIIPQGMDDPKTHSIVGDVTFHECAIVGANSVVMPGNELLEGVAVGALSFVPPRFRFEPWTVYAGQPIKKVMPRDRKNVLAQVEKIRAYLRERR
jgi:acetyltransferase-like isoleucine patch superfamily enzyme